jgi:hypothetical protein
MTSASEIVITGCSAGALGVYLGIDQMVGLIYSKGSNSSTSKNRAHLAIHAIADSGFFLEFTSSFKSRTTHYPFGRDEAVNKKTGFMDYANAMRDVFQFTNMSSGANSKCLKTHNHSPSDCVFAANLLPHIKTPIFLLQSQYDYWQIMHIYDQKYTVQGVNDFGRTMILAIKASVFYKGHPGHGIFVDSCVHHCTNCTEGENTWSGNSIVSQREKMTPATAFSNWYRHALLRFYNNQLRGEISPPGLLNYNIKPIYEGKNWFAQDFPFPCEHCCNCDYDMQQALVRNLDSRLREFNLSHSK